jgi:hypothetical protein
VQLLHYFLKHWKQQMRASVVREGQKEKKKTSTTKSSKTNKNAANA